MPIRTTALSDVGVNADLRGCRAGWLVGWPLGQQIRNVGMNADLQFRRVGWPSGQQSHATIRNRNKYVGVQRSRRERRPTKARSANDVGINAGLTGLSHRSPIGWSVGRPLGRHIRNVGVNADLQERKTLTNSV